MNSRFQKILVAAGVGVSSLCLAGGLMMTTAANNTPTMAINDTYKVGNFDYGDIEKLVDNQVKARMADYIKEYIKTNGTAVFFDEATIKAISKEISGGITDAAGTSITNSQKEIIETIVENKIKAANTSSLNDGVKSEIAALVKSNGAQNTVELQKEIITKIMTELGTSSNKDANAIRMELMAYYQNLEKGVELEMDAFEDILNSSLEALNIDLRANTNAKYNEIIDLIDVFKDSMKEGVISALAPEFDITVEYKKGQYVSKDGIIYICKKDIDDNFDPNKNWNDYFSKVEDGLLDEMNAKIDEIIKQATDQFASQMVDNLEFKTYYPGDMAQYNNKFYRCIKSVTIKNADEAQKYIFDKTYFEEVKLASIFADSSAEITAIAEALGSEYDPTETYNKGDIVFHDDKLYICTADGVTGTFDLTKWKLITITELFKDNYSDMMQALENQKDIIGSYMTNLDTLTPDEIEALIKSVASQFNPGGTYKVGDIVYEGNKIYEITKVNPLEKKEISLEDALVKANGSILAQVIKLNETLRNDILGLESSNAAQQKALMESIASKYVPGTPYPEGTYVYMDDAEGNPKLYVVDSEYKPTHLKPTTLSDALIANNGSLMSQIAELQESITGALKKGDLKQMHLIADDYDSSKEYEEGDIAVFGTDTDHDGIIDANATLKMKDKDGWKETSLTRAMLYRNAKSQTALNEKMKENYDDLISKLKNYENLSDKEREKLLLSLAEKYDANKDNNGGYKTGDYSVWPTTKTVGDTTVTIYDTLKQRDKNGNWVAANFGADLVKTAQELARNASDIATIQQQLLSLANKTDLTSLGEIVETLQNNVEGMEYVTSEFGTTTIDDKEVGVVTFTKHSSN